MHIFAVSYAAYLAGMLPTCRQTCRQACYSATPRHPLSFTLSMPPGVSFEHAVQYAVKYGGGHADSHKHVICPRCWQCRRPCRQAYHPACHCPACAERHALRHTHALRHAPSGMRQGMRLLAYVKACTERHALRHATSGTCSGMRRAACVQIYANRHASRHAPSGMR